MRLIQEDDVDRWLTFCEEESAKADEAGHSSLARHYHLMGGMFLCTLLLVQEMRRGWRKSGMRVGAIRWRMGALGRG